VKEVVAIKRPKKVLVCMIYYPCTVAAQHSWANYTLAILGSVVVLASQKHA
jgi:hypothetical protein